MSQSRTVKAGILASGTFLTTCVRLISAAVLSRVLSMYDYATYKQTLLAYAFVAPLLMLGLPNALYYFLPGENKRPRSVLVENFVLLSFMAGLFSLFLILGGNRFLARRFDNPDIARTLLILAPYPLFMLPASGFSACLIARDRVKQVAIFNVLSRLGMLVIVLGAVLIWRTPVAAIVGTVVGAGIVLLPALKLMFASCDVGSLLPSTNGMWSQLKYAIPLGLAGMIGTISKLLDKMIVSSMCSPEQFSVYVNGAIEIPLIGVLTGSVMAILLPDFVKMYKEAQYRELRVLWHRAMVKCSLLILPIMVFLLVMAPEVIRVLFSDKYVESVQPFRIYLLALPFRITTFGVIFMAARRNNLIMYRSATSLILNLFLSIILIRNMGYIGATISTVLIVYLWALPYNLLFISRILKMNIRYIIPLGILTKVLLVSIGSGVVFLLAPFVRPLGDVLTLAIFGLSYTLFVLVFFACFKLADMSQILSAVRRLLGRS
ncbi:MAG: polysaccharide biosynthesis protein [Planctomycetes bacterium]|nr:polysaccharide biosynthesis protein [Planctomycetota bacterium]